MEFTIQQIALMINGTVVGNPNQKINMLAKIQEALPGQIAFLANPKYENFIYTTRATAVIVGKDFQAKKELETTLIVVDNPYSSFTRLLEEYHKMLSFQKVGVESPSFIGEGAVVGEKIYRGAFSYVGNNVQLGNNVKIHPQTFVGDGCIIGDNTILHAGVKIYAGTRIGKNCEVHSGSVIGSDGFGFAPQEDGSYKTIPQLGNVVLEDNVSIGANSVIDCATMMGDFTIIRKGVKLDNLIQIAHNVEIGKNTVIAAQSGISGSSKVGENVMIGGQVGIAGHLEIADKVQIGAKSGISKSLKDVGGKYFGSPAYEFHDFFKSYAVFRKLPELYHRLRQLEEQQKMEKEPDTKG